MEGAKPGALGRAVKIDFFENVDIDYPSPERTDNSNRSEFLPMIINPVCFLNSYWPS